MARIHLVRHGRAAAGWDLDVDPPLDALGAAQAQQVAARLAPLGPLPIVTSPLRRCQETATPLAARWQVEPTVEAAVAEVPSPAGVAMADRVAWLRQAMAGSWGALDGRYAEFRDGVLRYVRECTRDTVIFSHFIAINAVIGGCLGDDRVVIRRLDNTSVTVVDTDAGGLRLVEAGHEADTLIR
jgi:broad specificity phosphatase PhoE